MGQFLQKGRDLVGTLQAILRLRRLRLWADQYANAAVAQHGESILVGLVVILTVIFAPRGLMGAWDALLTRLDHAGRARTADAKADAAQGRAGQGAPSERAAARSEAQA